jgi:hypothetical protein
MRELGSTALILLRLFPISTGVSAVIALIDTTSDTARSIEIIADTFKSGFE